MPDHRDDLFPDDEDEDDVLLDGDDGICDECGFDGDACVCEIDDDEDEDEDDEDEE